jgi:hypothetical protein
MKEYQRRFPERRVLDRQVPSSAHGYITESGKVPQLRSERPLWRNVDLEDNTAEMAERNYCCRPQMSDRVCVSRMSIRGSLHDFGLYPFHVQAARWGSVTNCTCRFLPLASGEPAAPLEKCYSQTRLGSAETTS